jgi:hypothetical protein
MKKAFLWAIIFGWICTGAVFAQSTTGLINGVVTDGTGALVTDAQITAVNQGTGFTRTIKSDASGAFSLPQIPPGVYRVTATKDGFETTVQESVQLEVNGSVTLNLALQVGSSNQTVQVSAAPPQLNTTSATLGDVIGHTETVDLPLNGREFTQLALLTPGASPQQDSQQANFTVALGGGGVSPSVNGQRGEQNNFTIDGVLNNSIFLNVFAIAPPPDAIQEFNVQSHITDAQFSISSGANINVATRSGTNQFHGDVWEFLRNDALDAQTYPDTQRLPYRQNQYGLYVGGPVLVPHTKIGKDNTFFSFYWEGYRSSQSQNVNTSTLTTNMVNGDFSAELGTTPIGTDSLGRPEYAGEIYDPTTSRPDPNNAGAIIRDPYPGNVIPKSALNAGSLAILARYYPAQNLNVPDGTLPNLQFNALTTIKSDNFGFRLDHTFKNSDSGFLRLSRSKANRLTPETLPTYSDELGNYAQEAALGYTHLFNSSTILNFRYGYTYGKVTIGDQPAGEAFDNSINFTQADPPHAGLALGPDITITDGYSGVSQFAIPLGPQEGMDYHLDLSKVAGNHTVSAGAMYYHVRFYDDGFDVENDFTHNATSIDGGAGATGFGPASFVLGAMHNYSPRIGNTAADQTVNWIGYYAQDLWQVTKKLALTAGIRWDYVAPPNYHKIVSSLDDLTGVFYVTGAVPPYFPTATTSSGFFHPQHNGYEPRFGVTYSATKSTVAHGAFAILDDHNNTLVQENQGIRQSWPTGFGETLTDLDIAKPTYYLNTLPSETSLVNNPAPSGGYGADPNAKIPYSIEYNAGVQQQLPYNMVAKLDYVGSVSRNQYLSPLGNTALYPGPGPISARQPYAQYGGPNNFEENKGPASYNGLQAQLRKSLSSGLFFLASYTYSKSLDWVSDPYGALPANFYNLRAEWGPSDFNHKQMFVFSDVYQLPVGHGKTFLSNSNAITQAAVGGWSVGSIISLYSGIPFDVLANGDVANVGGGGQRAERNGADPYSRSAPHQWLNTAAFAQPANYTYGNEGRNDLVGPAYKNLDLNASKVFPIYHEANVQFRAELFNAFNHANLGIPDHTVGDSSFGIINSAAGPGREIQFALKVQF